MKLYRLRAQVDYIEDFLAPEFYFDVRQLMVVYKDQISLQAAKGEKHSVDLNGSLTTYRAPVVKPGLHRILGPLTEDV